MSLPFLHPYIGLSSGLNTRQAASGAASAGGWVELGRTTLGSTADTISVASLADKRYLMVLGHCLPSGDIIYNFRLNGDTGSNYTTRYCDNGAADGTDVSISSAYVAGGPIATQQFGVSYLANYSTKEKLCISHAVNQNTAGVGDAPSRREAVTKHAQTTNPISQYTAFNTQAGDYASGSEVVVLGWDPADTHTNNFWTELANVTLTGAGDTLSSGTFTAKKYLWIQAYHNSTGGDTRASLRVGNGTVDSGNNYAYRRFDSNSGSEATFTTTDRMSASSGAFTSTSFWNIFIINNSAQEKLAIIHETRATTTGAGTAPYRLESVGKWTNTSNQINIVELFNDQAGDFGIGSIIKVWGSN